MHPAKSSHHKGRALDIKPDIEHITILDNVILAFQPHLVVIFGYGHIPAFDEILVGTHFRADETLLQVRMDLASSSLCCGA